MLLSVVDEVETNKTEASRAAEFLSKRKHK